MIGLNPKASHELTIDADVAESGKDATVFLAHGWTVAQESAVRASFLRANECTTEAERGEARYAAIVEVLRQSLYGWRKFPGADGQQIKFEFGADGLPTDDTLVSIPFWARAELATKIMAVNGLSSETVGKSVPSPEGATAT